jgi:hypothetical protein
MVCGVCIWSVGCRPLFWLHVLNRIAALSLAFIDATVRQWLCCCLASIWWTMWGSKMFENDVCTDSWRTVMRIPLILRHLLEISDFGVCPAACRVDRYFIRFPSLHVWNDLTLRWNMSWTLHFISPQITISAILLSITCTHQLRYFFIAKKPRETGGRSYSVCELAMAGNCPISSVNKLTSLLDVWLAATLTLNIPPTKK